jgi:hypothetical protein
MVTSILFKLATSIALKLLTSEALQDLLIWTVEKLAASTKTNVDDELVVMIKKHLHAADEGKEKPLVGE